MELKLKRTCWHQPAQATTILHRLQARQPLTNMIFIVAVLLATVADVPDKANGKAKPQAYLGPSVMLLAISSVVLETGLTRATQEQINELTAIMRTITRTVRPRRLPILECITAKDMKRNPRFMAHRNQQAIITPPTTIIRMARRAVAASTTVRAICLGSYRM